MLSTTSFLSLLEGGCSADIFSAVSVLGFSSDWSGGGLLDCGSVGFGLSFNLDFAI